MMKINKFSQGNSLCTRATNTSTHVKSKRLALTKEPSIHFIIFLAPATGSPPTCFASNAGSTLPNLVTLIYPCPPHTKHDEKPTAPSTTNTHKSVRGHLLLIRAELAAFTFLQTIKLSLLKSLPPL
ncbi:hypothetical protein BFJ66_g16305 [Fusarium oxysporum f. sp. cepae]|uniref:Uncharacterized protein n=1 Tax=Fusarium oxysporum f. sp. cepae TaxID=396571 RepID=A0A3L6NTY9_FUSOX|nr:hypothetical protein BFJ65_g4783 [Fusarium oxysporum f. sp. cepae]RKK30469.1 hypothetical protein BFJ66_g16305 [Fusarium oxysporum f. sp. cepae]RKK48131.1 hypothetical protein BFJ67_g7471 [Fusarium oxysporum f. sp. cepae]